MLNIQTKRVNLENGLIDTDKITTTVKYLNDGSLKITNLVIYFKMKEATNGRKFVSIYTRKTLFGEGFESSLTFRCSDKADYVSKSVINELKKDFENNNSLGNTVLVDGVFDIVRGEKYNYLEVNRITGMTYLLKNNYDNEELNRFLNDLKQ